MTTRAPGDSASVDADRNATAVVDDGDARVGGIVTAT
jgi:hypothetical protein